MEKIQIYLVLIQHPKALYPSGGATATTILNVDVKDFGAELRTIASHSHTETKV